MVYISFLICRLPPVHAFFQKKSILIKSGTKFSSTYFFSCLLNGKVNDFFNTFAKKQVNDTML